MREHPRSAGAFEIHPLVLDRHRLFQFLSVRVSSDIIILGY